MDNRDYLDDLLQDEIAEAKFQRQAHRRHMVLEPGHPDEPDDEDDKPAALRFADELEELNYSDYVNKYEAADELRRLYEANQAMLEALKELVAQTGDAK